MGPSDPPPLVWAKSPNIKFLFCFLKPPLIQQSPSLTWAKLGTAQRQLVFTFLSSIFHKLFFNRINHISYSFEIVAQSWFSEEKTSGLKRCMDIKDDILDRDCLLFHTSCRKAEMKVTVNGSSSSATLISSSQSMDGKVTSGRFDCTIWRRVCKLECWSHSQPVTKVSHTDYLQ